MDAKDFFDRSAGQWRSLRVTHHLAFQRAETGSSEIAVESLAPNDARIAEVCQMHQIDAATSVGGALVTWNGTMAWDKDDESHAGSSVFALIPDAPDCGKLLRERGYAEVVPVAGRYQIDGSEALVLTTDYDSMNVYECFWFPHDDLRLRVSTVKRFGGLTTATFCVEVRHSGDRAGAARDEAAFPASLCGW